MSTAQNDTYAIGGTQITLAPMGASVFPYFFKSPTSAPGSIKIQSLGTGATIQILPTAIAGASVGGATAVGASLQGWPMATTDTFSWSGPAGFYLACTGATSIIAAKVEYSAGATLA